MRRCPGNLNLSLPDVSDSIIEPALTEAAKAAKSWAATPMEAKIDALREARFAIESQKQTLARGIATETGKPIRECEGELGAVIGKFELTFADAHEFLAATPVTTGPHPSELRRIPRGPAVVIAPFNFPLHLGHGAAMAHLIGGNPVLFKPSPFAASVAGVYGELMSKALPSGVFQTVQGGAESARQLCLAPQTRSICFTGSVAAGREISKLLATEFDKDLALELGGKNPAIVLEDADLDAAAQAIADGLCLTCGQRCNATSRLLAAESILEPLLERLLAALRVFQPGDPLSHETKLGPLVSEASFDRHSKVIARENLDWILPGTAPGAAGDLKGYYVTPALARVAGRLPPELEAELFSPILSVQTFQNEEQALELAHDSPFGLTSSVFTKSAERFQAFARLLRFGNVYANLPTTFSPSSLPFNGLGLSSNRKPGGRGFVRFAVDEQAIQWTGFA